MRQVADGVWQIPLTPKDAVNAYVLGDVLVDAGTAGMGKKLPGKLEGPRSAAHTLTHAHPDHAGGSKAVVDALGVPMWAPAGDAAAIERGGAVAAGGPAQGDHRRAARGSPPCPSPGACRRATRSGGFRVLDTPGHSPGHVSFWRESDRVLVCGDVWFNLEFKTFRPGLRAPLKLATVDPARNRASMAPPDRAAAETSSASATARS